MSITRRYSVLKATKQKAFNKRIFGFDIETINDNKDFYCGSIWHENPKYRKTFYDKQEMIDYIKTKKFRDSFIAATNLGFDFFGLFHQNDAVSKFNTLFRGSDLLYAKTYIKNKDFSRKYISHACVTFIDTLSHAKLSVEELGKLIGLKKFDKPACMGRLPKNKKEKLEMERYNMRDSEISAKGLKFLFDSYHKLGATPKNTIAATAMSLFKNKFLKGEYFRHSIEELDFEFKAYYGGRTEAFSRGKIENYYYYDVNSLYPFVMFKYEYPDSNSLRKTYKNTLDYIYNYEGVSEVDIYCPPMEYPLLPYRFDNKLLFPTGNFSGVYTHVELRKALELGYTIKKVKKTYYFKETCQPFKEFVEELYETRNIYKDKQNRMEYVVKLLMNSLYGKFGQKFRDKDNWVPVPDTIEEINKLDIYERKGNYFRIKKDISEPAAFTIPIWAAYVTSYGRIHLYDLIKRTHPVYVDTDSIMTKKKIITGIGLGGLKEEMFIKEGAIVKPKFYSVRGNRKIFTKVKGCVKLTWDNFMNELLKNSKWSYTKFLKFKEALRRGLTPNEIVEMTKEFSLEDNKRVWEKPFDINELQTSKPHFIKDGVTEVKWRDDYQKAMDKHKTWLEKAMTVEFDWKSKGDDISKEEFFENEIREL